MQFTTRRERRLNIELLISRSLSLPRKVTTAMRDSLKANPIKAIRYSQLVDHLSLRMTRAYKLGYRARGDTLKRESERAKLNQYKKQARKILMEYQVSANQELKRIYREARAKGRTHNQARSLVLRRFRTLGVTAPATNRVKALYRTGMTSAYNQGKFDADRNDPAIWGWRWHTAGDDKVRHPTHSQFNKVTLPKSDPFWTKFYPPIDYNCRCRVKSLRIKQPIVRPPPNPVPVRSGFEGSSFDLN